MVLSRILGPEALVLGGSQRVCRELFQVWRPSPNQPEDPVKRARAEFGLGFFSMGLTIRPGVEPVDRDSSASLGARGNPPRKCNRAVRICCLSGKHMGLIPRGSGRSTRSREACSDGNSVRDRPRQRCTIGFRNMRPDPRGEPLSA
jgi:hypothetical protein